MTKIIYLNGPSSSGKTTIAKALQDKLEEPYLLIGIDKIIGFMPAKINNWKEEDYKEGFSWEKAKDPTGKDVFIIKKGAFAKRIIRSLKDIAYLLASQKYNLIIDDVAFGAIDVEEWRQTLKDFKVLYVGVVTPLEVLEQREKNRDNRIDGSARGQYYKVHENVSYDLEIDTYLSSIEENVEKILKALEK